MERAYFADTIDAFLSSSPNDILGELTRKSAFAIEQTQTIAWNEQIDLLRTVLAPYRAAGGIFLEYSIPRLGRRIDVVAIIGPVVFVIEFKVGESKIHAHDLDQVCDYALDLKNFHETSHAAPVAPVLVATQSPASAPLPAWTSHNDRLLLPI